MSVNDHAGGEYRMNTAPISPHTRHLHRRERLPTDLAPSRCRHNAIVRSASTRTNPGSPPLLRGLRPALGVGGGNEEHVSSLDERAVALLDRVPDNILLEPSASWRVSKRSCRPTRTIEKVSCDKHSSTGEDRASIGKRWAARVRHVIGFLARTLGVKKLECHHR
jgi:hypothetical protein